MSDTPKDLVPAIFQFDGNTFACTECDDRWHVRHWVREARGALEASLRSHALVDHAITLSTMDRAFALPAPVSQMTETKGKARAVAGQLARYAIFIGGVIVGAVATALGIPVWQALVIGAIAVFAASIEIEARADD